MGYTVFFVVFCFPASIHVSGKSQEAVPLQHFNWVSRLGKSYMQQKQDLKPSGATSKRQIKQMFG